MKTTMSISLAGFACILFALTCQGAGRGASSPDTSWARSEGLPRLSIEAAFEKEERDLRFEGVPESVVFKMRDAYVLAGLDLAPFLTIQGGGGGTEVEPGADAGGYGDSDSLWTVGATLNVWETPVETPPYLAHVLRLQATYSYWDYEAEVWGYDMSWNETRAAVLFSAEFFRDDPEPVYAAPVSAVLSFGPVYSALDGDLNVPAEFFPGSGGVLDFEEDEDIGFLVGFDINLAPNLSLGYEARIFDETAHTIRGAFHF